jgi:hypothetical protein
VALAKGGVWKLIAERTLSESISGWTLSPAVAKTFKGGFPPEGVIFAIKPQPQNVIINLYSLYVCPEFQEAPGQGCSRDSGDETRAIDFGETDTFGRLAGLSTRDHAPKA